jgi:hypothetical protein
MSTIISSKQMETKLYALVECLAANYGFNADEAFEFSRWETDVDHVGEILKVVDSTSKPVAPKKEAVKKEEPKKEEPAKDDSAEKISTCRKNIDLWQKKLDEGSVKDADKQREKIEKEQKKLDKLLEKLDKLLEKAPAPPAKVEAKKPEPKVEAKKAEPEKKEKRIKRFSPVMASQLKTALEGVKLEMADPLKKEFQQYIEDLTDDDFRKESMADHMRAFAKLKAPAKKEEVDNGAGVGFHLMKAEDSDMEESDAEEEVKMEPTATVVDVTLKELQEISMTATIDPPGTFWDADNGRFVKGPDADDDEDFEETTFDGVKYVVGEKTGRIYEARDTGDVFAGFKGVGKFKKMTV